MTEIQYAAWYREWCLQQAIDRHAEALATGDEHAILLSRTALRIAAAIHDVNAVDEEGMPLDTVENAARAFKEDADDGLVLPVDIKFLLRQETAA